MVFFADVQELELSSIDWNQQYARNNQTYRMLISICCLVLKGLLQTTADGNMKLMQFIDEQRMCRLYEKFILEYYRKEHPGAYGKCIADFLAVWIRIPVICFR